MKTNTNKIILAILMSTIGISASAGTRLCYVQTEDADGVYKDALGQKQLATDDYQNHILFQEGDILYTVKQSDHSEKVQVAMFNQKDKSTLVLAISNGKDGITLINEPTRRLIGCSAVNQ